MEAIVSSLEWLSKDSSNNSPDRWELYLTYFEKETDYDMFCPELYIVHDSEAPSNC